MTHNNCHATEAFDFLPTASWLANQTDQQWLNKFAPESKIIVQLA
jgi:hypothetical protein